MLPILKATLTIFRLFHYTGATSIWRANHLLHNPLIWFHVLVIIEIFGFAEQNLLVSPNVEIVKVVLE